MDDTALYERLLVMRCQLGDESALGELIKRHSLRLRYFLRKLVGGEEAVDDLLQDVWMAVFRGLPRLAAVEAFRPWLYRIARDQAFSLLRKQRRLPRAVAGLDAASHVTGEESPEFSADEIEAVHQALDDLPADQREALALRFLEGMSYEDIARVTDAPLGTVRSRIYYGKQALRAHLQGE